MTERSLLTAAEAAAQQLARERAPRCEFETPDGKCGKESHYPPGYKAHGLPVLCTEHLRALKPEWFRRSRIRSGCF